MCRRCKIAVEIINDQVKNKWLTKDYGEIIKSCLSDKRIKVYLGLMIFFASLSVILGLFLIF